MPWLIAELGCFGTVITRWSAEIVAFCVPIVISVIDNDGYFWPSQLPGIAASGGLMIAMNGSTSNAPNSANGEGCAFYIVGFWHGRSWRAFNHCLLSAATFDSRVCRYSFAQWWASHLQRQRPCLHEYVCVEWFYLRQRLRLDWGNRARPTQQLYNQIVDSDLLFIR